MNKKTMISLVVIAGLFFAGCSKERSKEHKNKDTMQIEINTSDDKPLKLPF